MKPTIGILGGTGHEGKGLALRFAYAGYPIVLGSRDQERARATAADIASRIEGASVAGASNLVAAERASICVLTVPYAAHRATLEGVRGALSGKVLIDVTVPLLPPKVTRVQLPPEGGCSGGTSNARP
jgi:NADPH-dependent F420 reductase